MIVYGFGKIITVDADISDIIERKKNCSLEYLISISGGIIYYQKRPSKLRKNYLNEVRNMHLYIHSAE